MTDIFQGHEPRVTRWYLKRVDPRHGAPDDESGALLPVRMRLLAAPGASIVLGNLIAYSTGLEFMLFIRHDPDLDPSWGGCNHYYEDDDPDQCLRFGLQFSDGSRVTSLDSRRRRAQKTPPSFLLRETWPGGNAQRWWVHPLPPAGPILLVLEWPVAARNRVTVQLDGDAIRAAASQSIRFWDRPS